MVWAEIILILIGVAMIFGSFYVTEKLSQQDIEQISLMSEKELKVIAEKQVRAIKSEVNLCTPINYLQEGRLMVNSPLRSSSTARLTGFSVP